MTAKQILRPIATVIAVGIGCYFLCSSLFVASGPFSTPAGSFFTALCCFIFAAVIWRKLKN